MFEMSCSRSKSRRVSWRLAAWLGLLALIPIGCGSELETRLAEIRAIQEAGQFRASLGELREILAQSPESPEANYRLAVALVQTGNPSRAIFALEKASEFEDYRVSAPLLLASIHFQLSNFEESIRAANRALAIEPDHSGALSWRAQANLAVHHLEAALTDTRRLVAVNPDDYALFVVHATVLAELGASAEAEAAQFRIKEMSRASGDLQSAARGCLAPAIYAKEALADLAKAEALYEDCAAEYPADPIAIGHILDFFDSIGRPERADELLRMALKEAPDNLPLHAKLAMRFEQQGKVEEAEAVLREAADRFDTASAWNLLGAHYRRRQEAENALEAIERAIALSDTGGERMRFIQADLLVDVGALDEAQEIAETFEEATYARMIEGRILLESGDPRAALSAFEEGLANWPNNAGARYLAGVTALRLGDFERAIIELRESVRVDDSETDAARILARLYYERAEYEQAIYFSMIARKQASLDQLAEGLKLKGRALAALGEIEKARVAVTKLSQIPSREIEAAVELAAVERIAHGSQAAATALIDLDLDLTLAANEAVLRVLSFDLLALDEIGRALTQIDSALQANPDRASLYALRGTVLTRANNTRDARRAFERALEIDSEQPEALGGLGVLIGRAGGTVHAVELLDRAAGLDPSSEGYPYTAAQLLLASGDPSGAEMRMREIIRNFAGHAGSRNDLAWMLAEQERDLDLALSLATQASRFRPDPEILDTLGFVHLQRGEPAQAVEVLEKAAAGRPDSASIHHRLETARIQAARAPRSARDPAAESKP